MICVSLHVNFVLKSTTLLLLCSYHVLKWELFILDSIILFLCFARSKFCSKISRFSMGIALTLARTARLTLYGTFFTIYCDCFIKQKYKLLGKNIFCSNRPAGLPKACWACPASWPGLVLGVATGTVRKKRFGFLWPIYQNLDFCRF